MSHDHPKHVTPDEHDPPDSWHQHAAEEKPQHAHGEVANPGLILGVGALMFAGLVATVVIVYGYYTWYTTDLLNRQEMIGLEQAALTYRADTFKKFSDYGWVREEPPVVPKDTVRIPLEQAAKKVATRYATQTK